MRAPDITAVTKRGFQNNDQTRNAGTGISCLLSYLTKNNAENISDKNYVYFLKNFAIKN
jgi:hypothetical protein